MAMLAFCVVALMSPSVKSEITLALSVSQPYGYVRLLCGRYYVISTNSYVDFFDGD